MVGDRNGGDTRWAYKRICAARRTAACLGGWEYEIQWEGQTDHTWELHNDFLGSRAGRIREEARRARMNKAIPSSLHGRLTGEEGEKLGQAEDTAAACRMGWEGGKGRDAKWVKVGGMSATDVGRAMAGDTEQDTVCRAIREMWELHKRHAEDGKVGEDAETENCSEEPASKKETGSTWGMGEHAEWCTWYAGGRETYGEEKEDDGQPKMRDRTGLEKTRQAR